MTATISPQMKASSLTEVADSRTISRNASKSLNRQYEVLNGPPRIAWNHGTVYEGVRGT